MAALGVGVGDEAQAVSIADDGCVLSAVEVVGNGLRGLQDPRLLDAVTTCLESAGLTPGDVSDVVMAGDCRGEPETDGRVAFGRRHRTMDWLSRARKTCIPATAAQASLLRAVPEGGDIAAVVGMSAAASASSAALVHLSKNKSLSVRDAGWGQGLASALREAAEALGCGDAELTTSLEAVARGTDGSATGARYDDLFAVDESPSITVDIHALRRRIDEAAREAPFPLDSDSTHVKVLMARRTLSNGVLNAAASAINSVAEAWRKSVSARRVVFTGGLFQSPEFRARMASAGGPGECAFPFDSATAIGAALHPFETVKAVDSLALGPGFSEQDIKTALENCRLEYLYEPDWDRLLARVSKLLAAGTMVVWFQGRCEFGGVSHGSRSILADASVRYARENVAALLLRHPTASLPFVPVPPAGESAGLGDERDVFHRLLRIHGRNTGSSGLFNVALPGDASPLAATPTEAVRGTFGSAAEVLVIERFLVAKDYWLLRSR